MSDGELAELRERVAKLEGKVAFMLKFMGTDPDPETAPDGNGSGNGVLVEWDGLTFMMPPGAGPEAVEARGRVLRRARDEADGKLPFDDAS